MILTGLEIARQVSAGRIRVDPFDDRQLNTNSYDVRIGARYLTYHEPIIDPTRPAAHEIRDIPAEGLVLAPGEFVLAETLERVGSDNYVPLLHAKSSTARSGLFVHVTADLIDIGSFGKLTLQLYATLAVRVFPGQRIAQVTFWKPHGEIELYSGKYQGSDGPRPSLAHLDFHGDMDAGTPHA